MRGHDVSGWRARERVSDRTRRIQLFSVCPGVTGGYRPDGGNASSSHVLSCEHLGKPFATRFDEGSWIRKWR
jgi:hypothetical protein